MEESSGPESSDSEPNLSTLVGSGRGLTMVNGILRLSERIYTYVCTIIYISLLFTTYSFYQRRRSLMENPFAESYHEIPEATFTGIMIAAGILAILSFMASWGVIRSVKSAGIIVTALFFVNIFAFALAGVILHEIDGVDFWKSAYVEIYLNFTGALFCRFPPAINLLD